MKLKKKHIVVLRHMLGSRRFICLSLAIICILLGLILLKIKFNLRVRTIRTREINIATLSMAGRYLHQSQLPDNMIEHMRQNLEERDEKLIISGLKSNEKYLLNYTDCLTRRFSRFEQAFSIKKVQFPLSFSEMMIGLHKECSVEVLGKIEDCSFRSKKTGMFLRHSTYTTRFIYKNVVFDRISET